jgi:hypothetical protein
MVYFSVRDKLSVICQAWFQQGDFIDYQVLVVNCMNFHFA